MMIFVFFHVVGYAKVVLMKAMAGWLSDSGRRCLPLQRFSRTANHRIGTFGKRYLTAVDVREEKRDRQSDYKVTGRTTA